MSRQNDTHHFFWKSKLSQWSKATFTEAKNLVDVLPFAEVTYCCVEQYMMMHKALIMGDIDTAAAILITEDPAIHQALGRQIKGFDQELWDRTKYGVVLRGNLLRFRQNKEHRDLLFATYPRQLVEASPHDLIWGVGLEENNHMIDDPENWKGENLLGKVLTEVRDVLMHEEGVI